jgi:hypothetical protein
MFCSLIGYILDILGDKLDNYKITDGKLESSGSPIRHACELGSNPEAFDKGNKKENTCNNVC